MTLATDLQSKRYQLNVVIQLGGVFYGRFQPDSGLVIPSENLIVGSVRIPTFSVDIRNVRTSLPTLSFKLLDKNGIVSDRLAVSPTSLLNTPVKFFIGTLGTGLDFSDYEEIGTAISNAISKQANQYTFSCRTVNQLLNQNFIQNVSTLTSNINSAATTIPLVDASIFLASGFVRIEDEIISYTSTDATNLLGATRGVEGSTSVAHSLGAPAGQVERVNGNPLELLLQLMISPDGGNLNGYELFNFGLGIPEDQIDIAGIEAIAISTFGAIGNSPTSGGDQYDIFLEDIGNILSFLEREILQATNCRFITKDGLISIALLDQTAIATKTINENSLVGQPGWITNSDKVVNEIRIDYNYSVGLGQFTRTSTFRDNDSITNFGVTKPLQFQFKGIQEALDGANIVADRATRLLARTSTPQREITVKTHLSDAIGLDVSDTARLTYRYLPSIAGGLGINDDLEVLSKGFNLDTGISTFKLQYTSVGSLGRVGVIGPCEAITAITDQSNFTIADVTFFDIGDCIKVRGEEQFISNIVGNLITVGTPFSIILGIGNLVEHCDYLNQVSDVTDDFVYICADADPFFPDSSSCYFITF